MVSAIAVAIGGFLFAAGAPLAVVNFIAIGFGATLIGAGITAAVSLGISALLAPSIPSAAPLSPSDGQIAIRQAVPPRMKSFGTVELAGVVWWFDVDAASSELHLGVALNHGQISAFDTYKIDNTEVTLDGSGVIQTTPYSTLSGSKSILTRTGAATETKYSEINSAFNVDEVRGDGVASMLVILDNFSTSENQFENFPNGQPQVKAIIDSSLCFDPRISTHVVTDKTTWAFSENPVICLLNYLIDSEGYGIAYARISSNIAEWKAAADYCDESITSLSAGGSEARYRIAITYFLTDDPKNVVSRILSAFDGRIWMKRDGSVGVSVGNFTAPTVTIDDDHILSVEMTRGQDALTSIKGVRAQYMSPPHDYREQDCTPWPDASTVVALTDERVLNVDLVTCPSFSQCRRLMKRHYKRGTAAWHGTIRTDLYGIKAIDERYINIKIDEIGIDTSFEVQRFSLDPSHLECLIDVIAVDETIDDWSPSAEESDAPEIPTGLVALNKLIGTAFDNLSSTSRLYNDDRTEDYDDCARREDKSNAYFGKSFTPAKIFGQAIVYGSKNRGFTNGSPQITLKVRGKNGVPSGRTDGTIIGTLADFTDTDDEGANGFGGRQINSTDLVNSWTHIWVDYARSDGDEWNFFSELDFWEYKTL